MKIAYYVTGHGFGHSVRCNLVAAALTKSDKNQVILVASTPDFLFHEALNVGCQLRKVVDWRLDPGVVQKDAVKVDVGATRHRLARFVQSLDQVLQTEIEWLKNEQIDVVLVDSGCLAVKAAAEIGLPSILVGNFTWDVILEAFLGQDSGIEMMKEMYLKMTHWIRTPGWIDCPSLSHLKPIPVDIIARTPRMTAQEVKSKYQLPEKVVVVSFGGHFLNLAGNKPSAYSNSHEHDENHEYHVQDLSNWVPSPWHVIVTGVNTDLKVPGFTFIPHDQVHLPDVLQVCQIVITKLGFATCTEIQSMARLKNQKFGVLYVPRKGFIEEEGLLQMMKEDAGRIAVEEMSHEEFESGWIDAIQRIVHKMEKLTGEGKTAVTGDLEAANAIQEIYLETRN